jgi:hypothetical protein
MNKEVEKKIITTSNCHDCDDIPKVNRAGLVALENNVKIQYMFNGVKILFDSYHSPWMNMIINNLKGHHKPQEELCFYHLVKLLDKDANMMELGCAWAYYSLFFKKYVPNGINICVEPNSEKMKTGIANIKLNDFDDEEITYTKKFNNTVTTETTEFVIMDGFIGGYSCPDDMFVDWDGTITPMCRYDIETIIKLNNNIFMDVLYSNIQGAEVAMLKGAKNVLNNIGFFVLSTHGDRHNKCLNFLIRNNFSILVQHSQEESFSGDGLIVAVNNVHLHKYEKNIDVSLKTYFKTNCKISRNQPQTAKPNENTIVICKVCAGGMCNRIIPFITSYRLSKKLNAKFYLRWDDTCSDTNYDYKGIRTTYLDMFEKISDVTYINDTELSVLINSGKILTIKYLQTDMHKYSLEYISQHNVIFFDNYVHAVYTANDNISITNYGSTDWILNKNPYLSDIQQYFKLLKPISRINDKINKVISEYFPKNRKNIIGIHVRHWSDRWLNVNNNQQILNGNKEKRIKFMENKIKENPNTIFFVSTTDKPTIKLFNDMFGNRIITFDDRFGDCDDDKFYISDSSKSFSNIHKNLNGIVDMFLLSHCNEIYGDVTSSYSYCAKLLSDESPIQFVGTY